MGKSKLKERKKYTPNISKQKLFLLIFFYHEYSRAIIKDCHKPASKTLVHGPKDQGPRSKVLQQNVHSIKSTEC
jgi:hypothetical protein